MNAKQVQDRVVTIVAEQLGLPESDIKVTSRFEEDLGGDSLDAIETVMALEEDFEIEMPDEEAEKLATVKDAIEYICGRKGIEYNTDENDDKTEEKHPHVILQLIVKVAYNTGGESIDSLKNRLHDVAMNAFNRGGITGDGPAIVENYDVTVSEVC